MRDAISYPRAMLLHPAVREEVINTITHIETFSFPATIAIRLPQTLRTIDEQNALYAQGRNGDTRPIVTKARGGSSFHNYGLAIDFALLYNGKLSWEIKEDFDHDNIKDWDEVVNAFKALGWKFGGDWKTLKDYPHLEKTFGLTWQQCLAKYEKNDFIPGTKYITI